MNIGIVIPEIGGYSSISIEFHKWHDVMTSLGHSIYIITGKSRSVLKNMTVMNELYHENEYNLLFSSKLFELSDDDTEAISMFHNVSTRIQAIINSWATTNDIDCILVENFFSIPSNLPVTFALYNFFNVYPCKKVIKHHDAFYRNDVSKLTKFIYTKIICFMFSYDYGGYCSYIFKSNYKIIP